MTAYAVAERDASRMVIAAMRSQARARGWTMARLAQEVTRAGYTTTAAALANQDYRSKRGDVPVVSVDQLIALSKVFDIPIGELAGIAPQRGPADTQQPADRSHGPAGHAGKNPAFALHFSSAGT